MPAPVLRPYLVVTLLAALAGASSVVACSSDPAAAPGGGDGGAADGSSGGDATGPDGGDGGAGSCGATTPVTTLGTVDINAAFMINAGDYLVFRDNTVGLDTAIPGKKTGGLVYVPKAGGAAQLALAPSAADRQISGNYAEGNTLYAVDFLLGSTDDVTIVKKTLPSGAVEPVGITGLRDGILMEIVAHDAANLYFLAFPAGGGFKQLYRGPKAGGAAELVTKVSGTDITGAVLVGDTLRFRAGPPGTKPVFYTAPANGNDVAPTKIDAPNKCQSNIVMGPSGVACQAGSDTYGYDPAFTNEKALFRSESPETISNAVPRLIEGDRVILVESSATPSVPIRSVPIGGGAVTKIACDRTTFFDIVADGTHLYWHEERDVNGTKSRNVYKMAK